MYDGRNRAFFHMTHEGFPCGRATSGLSVPTLEMYSYQTQRAHSSDFSLELVRGISAMSNPLSMRKVNLSLPADYIAQPAAKVREWLESNTSSLRMLQAPQILQRVRAALGPQITPLNDADVDVMIRAWAEDHHLPSVYPPSAISKAQENEIISRVKRILNAIPTSIEVKGDQTAIKISASGPTATLKSGSMQHSVSGSWTGELQFKTQAPGAVFTASVSPQNWNLSLTIGRLAPNLAEMDTVFKTGEAAVRGALGDLNKVDWSSPSKTKEVFSPYLGPVKAAVDAVSRSAALRPGEINFGAWVGGDNSGGVAGGVRLTIVF